MRIIQRSFHMTFLDLCNTKYRPAFNCRFAEIGVF